MHIAYIDCMNYANLCFLVSLVICPFSLPSAFLLLSIKKVSCLECRVEYFHILYFVLIFGAMGITWRRGEEANQWRPSHRMRREIYTFGKAGRIRHVKKYLVKK